MTKYDSDVYSISQNALMLVFVLAGYLISVVCPGAKGEVAFLAVKGEIGNIHLTGALSDGGRVPGDLTIIAQNYIGLRRAILILLIST